MSERKLTRTADTQSVPSGAKLLQRSEFSIRHAIAVVDALDQEYPHPVVFHWYSGTLKTLDTAIERGHFFSINPAMLLSKKGRTIVERIPTDRALTESDGPFINVSESVPPQLEMERAFVR